jgi:hypothetical protein
MTVEADLYNVIKLIAPRVFPDVAPEGTAIPFVTWQGLGGKSLRFLNNAAADKRHTFMQISVWGATRLETNNLIRQIENALCAANQFVCTPEGEPLSTKDTDTNYYGAIQRFSIYSSR